MKVHLFFILLRLKVYTNVRNIPYLVRRNGCIVHFLRISSFVTHGIESVGVGARSIRPGASPNSVCLMPNPLAKAWESVSGHFLRFPDGGVFTIYVSHWSYQLNHIRPIPMFSRAGWALHKRVCDASKISKDHG